MAEIVNARLTSLNSSTSKAFYSFSKGERFPSKKPLNQHVAYDKKSQFNNQVALGTGRPFFQSSQRFDYYSSPEKAKKRPSPSPLQYSIKGKFGKEGASPNQQFSFGVSRD